MSESTSVTKPKIERQPKPEAPMVCGYIDPQTRRELIAQAAYFRAQHRGFALGHEQEDWCAAEMEVDSTLNSAGKR